MYHNYFSLLKRKINSLKKFSYSASEEEIKNHLLFIFFVSTRNLHCQASCCCQPLNGQSRQEAASTLRGWEPEQLS